MSTRLSHSFTTYAAILLGFTLAIVNAQSNIAVIGFGSGPAVYTTANKNPLNKTQVTFPGFNFAADPAGSENASSGNWTWNAGLSIINFDTNATNYPLQSAANSTSNVINVAYTLDFPSGQLPVQNDTNWTLCSFVLDVPWTSSVLQRAPSDSGDCSTALGASCLNQIRQGWQNNPSNRATSNCPRLPDFTSFSECGSISTNGYAAGSGAIMSYLYNPGNKSSVEGLRSGQIFNYITSKDFNASQAQTYYNGFASQFRMMVMTFGPSADYNANHSGTVRANEVRTFCTILNKNASSAASLTTSNAIGIAIMLPLLVFIWQVLSI